MILTHVRDKHGYLFILTDSQNIFKLCHNLSFELMFCIGAVFLVVLAGVDAAYSGDWSRVGVISKSTEDTLKPLFIALAAFHVGCAVLTARIASSKGLSVVPRVLKVQHILSVMLKQNSTICRGSIDPNAKV